jgi:homoserine O-acetyltransferase
VAALGLLASSGTRLHGVGIEGDLLYGPRQVRALVDAARLAGATATYDEIRSDKGHDAFLVEWDQLAELLRRRREHGEGRFAASA